MNSAIGRVLQYIYRAIAAAVLAISAAAVTVTWWR